MTGVRARVPFPGLNYYGFEDADLFFGREEETRKMVGEILSTRLLVLFSPSGSGKTSLIQAGVRPQLEKLGYKTIYTRMENEPIPSLCHAVAGELDIPVCGPRPDLHDFLKQAATQAGKPLVIFLDQFEEFFIVYRDRPDLRAEFVRQVARIRQDDSLHVFLVLSLREDYFASLHEFSEAIPSIFQNNANIRLKPFTDEAARRAVEEPLKAVGFSIEEGLTDLLVRDLKKTHNREEKDLSKTLVNPAAQPDPGIEPIKLQIVCSELWNRGDETHSRISTAAYKAGGGVDSIVSRFIMKRLKKVSRTRRKLMERIFNALKTPDNTKRYRSFEDLTAQLNIKRKKHFKRLLGQLEQLEILRREERGGTTWYEYRHDYLVREVVRWMEERKEKRNRRRLMFAGFPGILLFLVLFVYFFIQYNTYYAEFTDKDYPYQIEEIVISRGFNPFKERITTGYFKYDLKDFSSENAVKNRLKISFWDKNEWSGIADVLSKVEGGEFLYRIGKPVDGFILFKEALKAEDNVNKCFDRLAELGRFDSRAIEIVIEAINDKNLPARVRYSAAKALVKTGKMDSRVIDVLVQALKDENLLVRSSAAEALGNIGKPDKVVIEALVQALKDNDWIVRSSAAEALVKPGKTDSRVIDVFVQALKDKNSNVRPSAAEALGNIGKPDKVVIEALLQALKDENSGVHDSAAQALVKLGKTDSRVIDVLVQALKDKNWDVRSSAAEALGNIGKPDKVVIEVLVQALKNSYVRSFAAQALVKLGKTDSRVIDVLVQLLMDRSSGYNVRSSAAEALGNIGKPDKVVIEALVQALKDEYSDVRSSAAQALVKPGKTDSRIIDALVQALKDKDWGVRSSAAQALGNIGKPDKVVIEALVQALKDSYVRSFAAQALVKLGKTDSRVIDVLVQGPKDEYSFFRSSAVQALVKPGKTDSRVIDVLVQALKDKNSDVRYSAAKALGNIGKPDKVVIEALVQALKDENLNVRSFAAQALGNLFQSKTDLQLLEMLHHNDSGHRKASAYALAEKHKKNPLSKETLQKIADSRTKDPRPWVRLAAWDAFYLLHEEKEGTSDD